MITSIFNILACQAFNTLMQLTKVMLFVISLPLMYFVHNRWDTEKQEQEEEIRQVDQDWAREVLQVDQKWEIEVRKEEEEWAREVLQVDQKWEIEVRKAEEEWARAVGKVEEEWEGAVREAEQEWKRETLFQNMYAAGVVNGSGGIFGLQQEAEIWKLTHPNEKSHNSNLNSSSVLRAKTGGPNTDAYMLAPWYLCVVFTIICWVILSSIIGFYIQKLRIE